MGIWHTVSSTAYILLHLLPYIHRKYLYPSAKRVYRDHDFYETGLIDRVYRHTMMALGAEMWWPFGFCGVCSGYQKIPKENHDWDLRSDSPCISGPERVVGFWKIPYINRNCLIHTRIADLLVTKYGRNILFGAQRNSCDDMFESGVQERLVYSVCFMKKPLRTLSLICSDAYLHLKTDLDIFILNRKHLILLLCHSMLTLTATLISGTHFEHHWNKLWNTLQDKSQVLNLTIKVT